MGFLSNLFTGGTSNVIDSIGNTLDKVITTKGERMQLELEMKKADMDFQTEMRKLSVREKELIYGDVDSARKMSAQIQTSSYATKLSKNTGPFLALGTTFLAFVLFYFVVFQNKVLIDNNSKDVVIYILGVLSAIITQIFSFYFGSSQGSNDKTKIMEDMCNQGMNSKEKA
jgi:hypothetical protein